MKHFHDEFADDLEPVVRRLQSERPTLDPLELDHLGQRIRSRHNQRHGRRSNVKQRIATILTVAGLAAGTGGAFAIANNGNGNHGNGGAASGEYKPGKGCGDKNHTHTGPPGNPGNTQCPNH